MCPAIYLRVCADDEAQCVVGTDLEITDSNQEGICVEDAWWREGSGKKVVESILCQ